jgi:DNA-binding CsgD family transcriptional regulator
LRVASTSDSGRIAEFERALSTFVDGEPPALTWALGAVREIVGADHAVFVSFTQRDGAIHVEHGVVDATSTAWIESVDRWVAEKGIDYLAYHPMRPVPADRNRVVSTGDLLASSPETTRAVLDGVYAPCGFARDDELRALLCDGPSLLGRIGLLQSIPLTARQRRVFERLIEPLRKRLAAERALIDAPFSRGLLDAAMSSMPTACFVVDERAQPLEANLAGQLWLDRSRASVMEKLRAAVLRGLLGDTFQVISVVLPSRAKRFLVVHRPVSGVAARVAVAAARWGLTPRETEVVHAIAEGLSNRTIAASLAMSERTAEVHVASILNKAQLESRSELIVAVWKVG